MFQVTPVEMILEFELLPSFPGDSISNGLCITVWETLYQKNVKSWLKESSSANKKLQQGWLERGTKSTVRSKAIAKIQQDHSVIKSEILKYL